MANKNDGWVHYPQLNAGKSLLRDILDRVREYQKSIDYDKAMSMNDFELLQVLSELLHTKLGL